MNEAFVSGFVLCVCVLMLQKTQRSKENTDMEILMAAMKAGFCTGFCEFIMLYTFTSLNRITFNNGF